MDNHTTLNSNDMNRTEDEQMFYDKTNKAENMDPLKAMTLLTKACMDYMYVNASYRSKAYYASWAWLNVFNKTGRNWTNIHLQIPCYYPK